jgi:hypothetical protein
LTLFLKLIVIFTLVSCSQLPKVGTKKSKGNTVRKIVRPIKKADYSIIAKQIELLTKDLVLTDFKNYVKMTEKNYLSLVESCKEENKNNDCLKYIYEDRKHQLNSLKLGWVKSEVIDLEKPFQIQIMNLVFDPQMTKAAEKINKEINKFFQESLCYWPINIKSENGFTENLKSDENLASYISTGTIWHKILKDKYILVGMNAWSFCGGAHGNPSQEIVLFDSNKGKILKLRPSDLIADSLNELADDLKEKAKAYECDLVDWNKDEWDIELLGDFVQLSPNVDFPQSDISCYELINVKLEIKDALRYIKKLSPSYKILKDIL